ncbi:MAG: thioesterase domain-containing protein, partial [Terriglobales bacterium]
FHDLAADPSQLALDLARLNRADASPATEIVYTQVSNQHLQAESTGPTTMPERELLQALLPLWQRVLGIVKIDPDDDFFVLGGHSVAAAQLFSLIQRELGCTAPLATLYDSSTPRTLARVLSQGGKPEAWQSLVAINRPHPSNDRPSHRPPLFLVHGAEGNILLYRSLAAHLGADQPVFGLQSAGLDGRSPIDGRFENVAHRYIEEIRQVQPHGPYMLGGYCLGGTLALEMARQLIASGETVGLLALIEIYNIRSISWPLSLRQRLINRWILNPYFHLDNLLAAEGEGKRAFFMEKLRVETTRIKASAHFAWARLRDRFQTHAAAPAPQAKIADIYEEALAHYEVRPYPGELTLFLAKRHLAGFHDRLGGWGDVAQGGVRLHSLPISPRGSLVEPHVRQLAAILRACLDRATENSKPIVHEPKVELLSTH